MNFNIGINVNLEKLIETRLLIQANSGGGKSYSIRKLLEETNGKVQQIVLDLEGEFFSLREKYDFIVFGKEGDYPVHIKYADKLARTLLEHSTSAIIDLYELKSHERITFVKRFLESMINAPKELWHPCLVVIDEAHLFAPEKGSAESLGAVIDLCTRGRKRGYCAVLATQRLSKLHKDAAAECNNKLIGRTGLDVDMKRAGDELGFTNKMDMLAMRELEAGSFFAFGPAISNQVTKFRINEVETFHPKTGSRLIAVPPASEKIKKVLAQFKDLPAEAEKELNTAADMRKEITQLRTQLTLAQRNKPEPKPIIDMKIVNELKAENKKLVNDIKNMQSDIKKAYSHIAKHIEIITVETKPFVIPKEALRRDIHQNKMNVSSAIVLPPYRVTEPNNDKITGGAMRMLKAAAMYSNGISKQRMAALAGLSHTSGTFGTYMATLKKNGLIEGDGNTFVITEAGLEQAGDFTPLPTDPESIITMWCNVVKGGAARMLQVLAEEYPNAITNNELGERAGLSHQSGTFGTYKATLKRNGLITVSGNTVKAADELFR